MNRFWEKTSRAITAFVENPIINLLKGIALLVIGVSEASRTLREDFTEGHLRVGHGIVIIGFFTILETLPKVIEGLEASRKFLDHKPKKEATQGPQG